ncbi:MAG: hypothetical protein ACTS85_01450 [Arsenophonus sp. NC-PG7-MAG3]
MAVENNGDCYDQVILKVKDLWKSCCIIK